MSGPAVRVLLVDDDDLMRAGLRAILSSDPAIEVVGEAGDGAAALAVAAAVRPEVVLMDVRMPGMDGIAATERLVARDPGVRVLVLTTFEEDDDILAAVRAGASGFVLKRIAPEELISAIRVIAAGESLLSPSVTRRLIAVVAEGRAVPPPADGSRTATLTAREREVLGLMARGLSNDEIAAELVVEPSTVKSHVKHVLGKLGARDRVQAVIAAFESGLAPAPGRRGG